jgi:hypothetical protein
MTTRIVILAAMASAFIVTATFAKAGEPIPGVDVELGNKTYNRAFKPSAQGSGGAKAGIKMTDGDFESKRTAKPGVNTGSAKTIDPSRSNIPRQSKP